MLLPSLQEVLQKLPRAGQGQVLKRVSDAVPELQNVQPIFQPGQMDDVLVSEPAEGLVDQV